MKRGSFIALLALAVLQALAAGPAPLMLQPGQLVPAGAAPLAPGSQAIPCVADWNGDGLPDLLVGYQPASKVALYLNSGTRQAPRFTTFTNLQAGAADLVLPSTACGAPAPWVCDYDADGRRDLLAGAGADGRVWFYRNTNTDAEPLLAAGVKLSCNGADLSVAARATPFVHDWDEDGLPDLLCGDGNGNVQLFRNTGSNEAPSYAAPVLLQAGLTNVNFGWRSAVRVCDWDGDGLKDLLGSGSDNLAWCRNTGDNSAPVLQPAVRLQSPNPAGALVNIDTGYRMRLELADLTGDGLPDLLIGNWDGCVYLYESYRFLLAGPLLSPKGSSVLEWNSAPYLRYHVLSGHTPDHVSEVTASTLPSAGKQTRWTNSAAGERRFFRVQLAP